MKGQKRVLLNTGFWIISCYRWRGFIGKVFYWFPFLKNIRGNSNSIELFWIIHLSDVSPVEVVTIMMTASVHWTRGMTTHVTCVRTIITQSLSHQTKNSQKFGFRSIFSNVEVNVFPFSSITITELQRKFFFHCWLILKLWRNIISFVL